MASFQQIDLLGSLEEPRGGARTPSPTSPYPGGNHEENYVHDERHDTDQEGIESREGDGEIFGFEDQEAGHPDLGQAQGEDWGMSHDPVHEDHAGMKATSPERRRRRERSRGAHHEALAMVGGGGVLYNPTARALTQEAIMKHNMKSTSRSRSRGEPRRNPDAVASSFAASEVMLTSTVLLSSLLHNQI